ncbi:MAG TPA: ABC transporter ATP-binding protein [Thermoanaerobaculia bacterium]|nr:ABC transporter ATP-binding protein [Thermoanaerobaculia bacterium]
MNPLLQVRRLAVGYRLGRGRELRLLDGADFELSPGELVCLLGPNGSGKSTLLRTIGGMQRPLEGHVMLLGRDLRGATAEWLARHVSVVLTEPVDVGALTARELVGLGRYPYTDWLGRLTAADRERVAAAIAAVGAGELAERLVRSLSDGERQRVLIARALAQEPELMILDEPTAYLDLPRRIETLGLLRRLARETQVTVLLSTHHLDLALSHADRVWLLPRGGPLEIGSPEDVALSGALERTFVSERLEFDPAEGTFRLRDGPAGSAGAGRPVALEGDGVARRWAERALRREGFVPVAAPSAASAGAGSPPPPFARVRIVNEPTPHDGSRQDGTRYVHGPVRFELEIGGEAVLCASVHELVLRLREGARRPRAELI